MTRKRVYILYFALAVFANILMLRLFFIVSDRSYAETAAVQTVYSSVISVSRPDFYDCNGVPLTGTEVQRLALIIPSEASELTEEHIDAKYRDYYMNRIAGDIPFTVEVDESFPETLPVKLIEVEKRYSDDNLAPNLIGYLDFDGNGVSGLELAFEEYFAANSTDTTVSVDINANRRMTDGSAVEVFAEGTGGSAVTLTIDSNIQRAAENIADSSFERGAIIVAECATGEIKAMVSRPDFNPNDIASAISQNNAALINRAITPYNLGSVYKVVIAAAALEAGITEYYHECVGSIEVGGVTYGCNNRTAHGELDLKGAMTASCNTYFIALGQRLGGEAIYNTASKLGIGRKTELYNGYFSQSGLLPPRSSIVYESSELVNHCFGQGRLMATPLQVATYTACVANGGIFKRLSVVKSVGETLYRGAADEIALSTETAEKLTECMTSVIDSGTGRYGKPDFVSAAGKTGTAQTGRYNSDGSEMVIGWFSGFFPAENPRYTVTVMVEDEGYGYETAAPVFRDIADYISVYTKLEIS